MNGPDLLIDPVRSTCLSVAGAPSYRAAVVLDIHGDEHLVLAEVDRINDETARVDISCAALGHEQTGPLPHNWSARVELAPLLCGRPTRSGRRCRQPVQHPGDNCAWHRTTERAQ